MLVIIQRIVYVNTVQGGQTEFGDNAVKKDCRQRL